jgi:hypothetical protein
MSFLIGIMNNKVFLVAMIAWGIAQLVKAPINYLSRRQWDWSLFYSSGGMPSSHAALVTGCAFGVGFQYGFDSTLFAVAWVLAGVVIYDAIGIRRAAGNHARMINLMMDELLTGHPLAEQELEELLGHTPRQVFAGTLLGIAMAYLAFRVF